MRVLHVLDHSLPLISGYSSRSHYILREQRRRGLDAVALTSPLQGRQPEVELEGVRYLRAAVPLPARSPLRELVAMAGLLGRLWAVARRWRPQLVHAHSPVLCGLPALAVARRLGVPLVYEVRALWEDAAVDQGKCAPGSARYRLTRGLEGWLLRRAAAVTTICEGLRREILGRGARRVVVAPNGVDPERFRPLEPDRALARRLGLRGATLGFIGSFYRFEGVELLVEAFGLLAGRCPEWRLVLVGEGERFEAVRRRVGELGLAGRVVLAGRVPHQQVRAWYSVIDLLAYPRLRERITEMVTPLKPLEAMAMQRAVLGSDVGGLREILGESRFAERLLVPAGDARALAEGARGLLADGRLLEEVRRDLRRVALGRSWPRVVERYLALYAELCGSSC